MLSLQPTPKRRAIVYLRTARAEAESLQRQRDQIEEFIIDQDIDVIHEEIDFGVSGLTLSRPGLKKLFKKWIQNPDAPAFEYVILNDVSRWGRFQNPNIIAHYESLCKLYGKKIIYVSCGMPTEYQQTISHSLILDPKHGPSDRIEQWRNNLSQWIVRSLTSNIS